MSSSPSPRLDAIMSSSGADLTEPDVDSIIRAKRKWWHHPSHLADVQLPRSVQVPLTCLSIGLSAVQANGVYCWPT